MWLDFCGNPEEDQTLNRIGDEIDQLLWRLLPTRRLQNMPFDWAEIRQETGLLLYTRYLAGNEGLAEATLARNHAEIAGHIQRSVWMAIKVTVWRYRKKHERWMRIFASIEKLNDHAPAICQHPANHRRLGERPFDLQLKAVTGALRQGVREKRITTENVKLARELLEGEVTHTALAKHRVTTRQAINQRLAPGRHLRNTICNEEFPLL